jgi:hypothetical protein
VSRPACPLCRDPFCVVRVPTLARLADPDPTAWWQPPPAPRRLGRWLCILAPIGLLVTLLTGFHLVWLVLALASGLILELYEGWAHAESDRAARQAWASWRTACFCTVHEVIFAADGSWLGPPAALRKQLQQAPTDPAGLLPQYSESAGQPS